MANPFSQTTGSNKVIAATTTSGSVALAAITTEETILISNDGTTGAYVRFGSSAPTATNADLPIAGGTSRVVALDKSWTHAAAIMATGTANISFSTGYGGS